MVNPAPTERRINVLPWEVFFGVGAIPSRCLVTDIDAGGEVSRGHSSPETDEGPNSAAKEQVRLIRWA